MAQNSRVNYYIGVVVGTDRSKWYMLTIPQGYLHPAVVMSADGRPLMWKSKQAVKDYAKKNNMHIVDTDWVYAFGGAGDY